MGIHKNKKAFGDAVSTMIMFIAIVSVTTGLVIAFINYAQSTQQSFTTQSKLSSNQLRTSLSISNIYYNTSSNNIYIYVKNIGETQLTTKHFDLFVDNVFYKSSDYSIFYADNLSQNITLFKPQETLVIVHNINLESGTHDVLVKSEYGVGDEDVFNI